MGKQVENGKWKNWRSWKHKIKKGKKENQKTETNVDVRDKKEAGIK